MLGSLYATRTWKIGKEKDPLSINIATFQHQLCKLTFLQLIEATNGFPVASIIMSGGCGEVSKASSPSLLLECGISNRIVLPKYEIPKCFEEIHDPVIRFGFWSEVDVLNALITMHAKCGYFDDARKLFDDMPMRDYISWNVVISGHFEESVFDGARSFCGARSDDYDEHNFWLWIPTCSCTQQKIGSNYSITNEDYKFSLKDLYAGGNAKLVMICNVSLAKSRKSEIFSTLRFAQRAKAIKNKAIINETTEDDANVL
ncbi:hypothetical protein M5K25_017719 [Dendrobium thyrsiflorum]|uniref:Kinesin motor domain-containing protein n=1 Tax=Dendrobium thyrsiflorum TaxID=117978 RepID=A0ABD0UN05_DENTH